MAQRKMNFMIYGYVSILIAIFSFIAETVLAVTYVKNDEIIGFWKAGQCQNVLEASESQKSDDHAFLRYKCYQKLGEAENAALEVRKLLRSDSEYRLVAVAEIAMLAIERANLQEVLPLLKEAKDYYGESDFRDSLYDRMKKEAEVGGSAEDILKLVELIPAGSGCQEQLKAIIASFLKTKEISRIQAAILLFPYTDGEFKGEEEQAFFNKWWEEIQESEEGQKFLKKQLVLRNHSFTITHARRILTHSKTLNESLRGPLQNVYIKAMKQKRLYGALIHELKPGSFLRLDPKWSQVQRAKLYILGRHYQAALDEIRFVDRLQYPQDVDWVEKEVAEAFHNQKRYYKALDVYLKLLKETKSEEIFQWTQWKLLLLYGEIGWGEQQKEIAKWSEKTKFDDDEQGAQFCYWNVKLQLVERDSFLYCYYRYPKSYYGLRSLFVHRADSEIDRRKTAERLPVEKMSLEVSEHSFIRAIRMLLETGEELRADFLVRKNSRRLEEDLNLFIGLVHLMQQYDRHHVVVWLLDVNGAPKEIYTEENQLYYKRLYYPLAFEKLVAAQIQKFQVPELFIYSIMREESRFRSYVVSGAGATGLLQLMPETARFMGRLLKRKLVNLNDLTLPDVNLFLGVGYVKRLLKRYSGNMVYVLAGYNGGPTNVRRWQKKLERDDDDYFVESITFPETQNYVKKVMRSYYNYQLLYGVSQ